MVSSLILITQVIALFVQYKVNKAYKGIEYWLLGSGLMSLGFILMIMVSIKNLEYFARIANPLLVLGHISLYIGIKKFLNRKIKKWIPISIFAIFNIFYYYYMYFDSLSGRTISICIALALISFMLAYEIFSKKGKLVSGEVNFTAAVFFIYGSFFTVRAFLTILGYPAESYVEQGGGIIATTLISIIMSNLWTLGLIIMINQKLNLENQLEKEKLQLIFNTNLDAQLITRLEDGFIVDANTEFYKLTGYSKVEVIGNYANNNNFWHDLNDRKTFIREIKENGFCQNMEFTFHRKDKTQFNGLISGKIIMIDSATHIINVIRDITERKRFEDALIESEEKYRSILNASPDDITITDLTGTILMVSPAAKEMFGYDPDFENFIGLKLLDFLVPEDVERAEFNISKMRQNFKRNTNEYRAIRKNGHIFDVDVNSGFIFNASGIPDKMVFIIRDITKRKLIESQMRDLVKQLEIEKNTAQLNSITDSLSGLYNRRYFDYMLNIEFSRLTRSKSTLSLIMIDIDYFKKFNDTYGHLAGDNCLKIISNTLKISFKRPTDTVVRYGGEEFFVILPEIDESNAKILGEKILNAIEDLKIPHESSKTSKHVTVSAGIITMYPSEFKSTDEALKLVDEALYAAKEKGRNCCVFSEKKEVKIN